MKVIVLTLTLLIFNIEATQDKALDKWIQHIVNDMIEMNDLDKYSYKAIPSDTDVNFIMVESVKDITVKDDIITMLVNHGKGVYCTELKFKYTQRNGTFFLVFGNTSSSTIFGKDQKFINPWIDKNKICD